MFTKKNCENIFNDLKFFNVVQNFINQFYYANKLCTLYELSYNKLISYNNISNIRSIGIIRLYYLNNIMNNIIKQQ